MYRNTVTFVKYRNTVTFVIYTNCRLCDVHKLSPVRCVETVWP